MVSEYEDQYDDVLHKALHWSTLVDENQSR